MSAPALPIYRQTAASGRLQGLATRAQAMLAECRLCPRGCGANRLAAKLGFCGADAQAMVASFGPHFGEERPLVGRGGSGTIFFTHCNLRCNFCQNYDISQQGQGEYATPAQLGAMMLQLQDMGCHNINFVTPSHVVPQILAAVSIAAAKGLSLPLVFNTAAYDSVETLQQLEGVIDIYMPDFKFWHAAIAARTCAAPDYRQRACAAIKEMHRQVGDLIIDAGGLAVRGLLLRHLVLPDDLAGTARVMDWVAREVSRDTYVNLMSQYRPCGRADEMPQLARRLRKDEFESALAATRAAGLERLDPWAGSNHAR